MFISIMNSSMTVITCLLQNGLNTCLEFLHKCEQFILPIIKDSQYFLLFSPAWI